MAGLVVAFGVVIAFAIALAVVLVTHQQHATIDCVPGYHLVHGSCVKGP